MADELGVAPLAPGWFEDPTGRHQFRWFDAQLWTDHVADEGATGVDPVFPPPAGPPPPPNSPSRPPAPTASAVTTAAPPAAELSGPALEAMAAAVGPKWMGPPRLSPAAAVLRCLGKYAVFSGRASRSEFWWFALAVIVTVLLTRPIAELVVDPLLALAVQMVVAAGLVLPGLAVTVRRLHDTFRSGWWALLLFFIPGFGLFPMLYFLTDRGSDGVNRYGPPSP